jgi:hypothetical protein
MLEVAATLLSTACLAVSALRFCLSSPVRVLQAAQLPLAVVPGTTEHKVAQVDLLPAAAVFREGQPGVVPAPMAS